MRQDNNFRSIDGIRSARHIPKQDNGRKSENLNSSRNRQSTQFSYYKPPNNGLGHSPDNTPKKPKKGLKKRLKRYFLWGLVLLVLISGAYFYNLASVASKIFHGNVYSVVKSLFSSAKLNGESTGRVNILLAGYQGTASDEGALTDSIMVVSVDTQNNTAFTLSIPRDFYLNVPGVGDEKINAANDNSTFSQKGYFEGGIGQLQKTIEKDFNIPINYYALINYNAFEQAVNAVNGITVNIKSTDPRGLYDPNVDKAHGGPLKLPNGQVTLNGIQALALALARGDSPYAYGFPLADITRTEHQRQELIALEQKALSTGVLSNPVAISRLVNAIGNNVSTNLSLPDVLRLAQLAHSINFNNIKSYGFSFGGTNPLLVATVINGIDQLIPTVGLDNFTQIQHYYLQITSSSPIVQESASITILNASNTSGLAKTEENILTKAGLLTNYIGDASGQYNNSMLIDLSAGKKPATLNYLEKLLPKGSIITHSTYGSVEANEGNGYSTNFILIEGLNWPTN